MCANFQNYSIWTGGRGGMLLFLSQWRGKWTSKETVKLIDYWQLGRSRLLGYDTNTPLRDTVVTIYNCRDSIVPKCHTAATQWTCGWMKWGQWSRASTQREGGRKKENERSEGPTRKNRSEWHTVGRNCRKKRGGKVLLRWRTCEKREEDKNLKTVMKREWGDLLVDAPLFKPSSPFPSLW